MVRAIPTNKRAIQLAIFIAFGFLFGYDIGVISGCLIMPDFINRFGEMGVDGKMVLSSSRQSIITSLLSAGTFVGAIAQAFTSDRFGRRGSILIWTAIFTVGVAVQTGTEFSIVQITIGRFIAGLGVGALSAIVPLYNGETAPKALRGTLLVLYQLQIIIGLFLSYILDLATHTIKSSASWRIPVGLQLLWGLILLSGIFFLPESPRHLLGLGKTEDARTVIAELNGVPRDDALVDDIMEELDLGIRAENEGGKATWLECFSTRNNLWKRTGNGMMLQFIQQLNGQNFYYYYGDTFFQSAGTELSPYVIQVILGAVSVVGTVPALYLIETWGRRRSLLTGALMEALCAIVAGLVGHFTLAPPGTPKELLTARNKAGGDTLIAFAVLHVCSFSIFWGPTPWVYLGESFPLRVRPKSIALGSATNWLWNFLLSFFAPRIAEDIGPLILLIFFGMLLFGYVYVYLFIPETKGLSLEEVDEMYRSGVKPWNSADWKPHLTDQLHHEKELEKEVTEVRESAEKQSA
ncbi:Hexose transporter 2 [Hypsizygus marmoreus]|uniref:Hexose transporter 2 n=1 Tax=Hypsizygus marmoreus TaxID=39966 RepID=A0A369K3I0_HYPMA|nr:Hexose transporter 2 [Hypsizygus marmoreus]